MKLVTGTTGVCEWAFIHGTLDDVTMEQFVAHLRRMSERIEPGRVVLDITHDVGMPTAVQRRRIVEALQSSPKLDLVAGHALVINSTLGRGLLTAINWIVRPPFEERVCATPTEALDWLATRNAAVDPSSVLTSLERAVPGFSALSW
ncbi:MAG: STAS/SEC14 domain-containing protein [Myxococcales bacterium]|nr:STAS/SEC14 domain-containing protein [Myxococcales bacterium]